MKLTESVLTKNPCYTTGRKIRPQGLMLHSVGCPQPSARVFMNRWDNPNAQVCVHGFIDGNDGTVYQTLPWDSRAWHCGRGSRGSGNDTHIGVEMCEPACIKYTGGSNFTCSDTKTAKGVVKRTYDAAVELFAMLCAKYGLDPLADGVVISHKEGCARGIASNHGDPEHLWAQLGLGYTMDTFRTSVRAAMKDAPSTGSTEKPKKDKPAASSASFQVRVEKQNLNIRKGPGTNYAKTGKYTGTGVFTIVKVTKGEGATAGWGLLKSYEGKQDGWISLDYTKRV